MLCAEWYNVVDCRQMSTVESMSKAFFAVDSGACPYPDLCTPEQPCNAFIITCFTGAKRLVEPT
eukprot:1179521-Prorocentrum_minimum.AAC.1